MPPFTRPTLDQHQQIAARLRTANEGFLTLLVTLIRRQRVRHAAPFERLISKLKSDLDNLYCRDFPGLSPYYGGTPPPVPILTAKTARQFHREQIMRPLDELAAMLSRPAVPAPLIDRFFKLSRLAARLGDF